MILNIDIKVSKEKYIAKDFIERTDILFDETAPSTAHKEEDENL